MKVTIFLTIISGLVTVGILWVLGTALSPVWRALVALYGGITVVGILSVLLKE